MKLTWDSTRFVNLAGVWQHMLLLAMPCRQGHSPDQHGMGQTRIFFLGIRRMKQGKLTGFFPKGLQSTLSPGRSCLMSWQLSGTCCAYARVLMGQVGPLERGRNWNCTYHRIWVQRMLMLMWHVNLLERPVRYWFPQKWIREDHLFVMLTRQSVCNMHWNKRDMLTACTRGHMRVTWICQLLGLNLVLDDPIYIWFLVRTLLTTMGDRIMTVFLNIGQYLHSKLAI